MARIREHNRELIIQVASELFADKGFAATKIIDIANRAEIPKANIFYYFKNKKSLYLSVLETVIELLLQASSPFQENNDPVIALKEYIQAKIAISQSHPHASKVFAVEMILGAPHLSKEIADKMTEQTQQSSRHIQSWIDRGLIKQINPHHLLFTIWASTQTYADFSWQILKVTGKEKMDKKDYEQAADFIVELVLKGCDVRSSMVEADYPHWKWI